MQSLKILVVDDDAVTRSLIFRKLKKADYEVDAAEDGVEAVRLISDQYYDVILTDLMMPGGVDGIGVLESAKANNLKTEVILITAHGTIENAITAMKKGAADYLQKPIIFDELFLRLDKIQSLKNIIKNATDLREAMDVTEKASCETIQNLELTVDQLKNALDTIESVLARKDLDPEERINMAIDCYQQVS
ncbi:MAG: response regulator [Desulfobacteraceae bacterium]|nr:response regulator [Desulfobacteraceae bacterium]